MWLSSKIFWIKLICCCFVLSLGIIATSKNLRLAIAQSKSNSPIAEVTNQKTDSVNSAKETTISSKEKTEIRNKVALDADDSGCKSCHTGVEPSHINIKGKEDPIISCVYCHGGKGDIKSLDGAIKDNFAYEKAKNEAHILPRFPNAWRDPKTGKRSSANPIQSNTLWLKEDPNFVRFVNPGDLRIADISCGECHDSEVKKVKSSMMTHGGMLWGAALYNNGAYRIKNTQFGESYSTNGKPQKLFTQPPPTSEETRTKGIVPFLGPLPRWEISQPGNILRVFERGGRKQAEVGNPLPEEPPGLPEAKLSPRGFGTVLRTDPVFLGLQKTRLLDPILSFMGTNDQPGDYRSSGCTACHTPYANDRFKAHSAQYAKFGNDGKSFTADPTILKNESGHPIQHRLTSAIPTSQCFTCHMHPGTNMVTGYAGYMWWDNETDGEVMYPKEKQKLNDEQIENIRIRNPEGSATKGKWGSDLEFLKEVSKLNPQLKHTQFADFHGHGWIFRAVFKQDRKGNLLDAEGSIVKEVNGEILQKATAPYSPEEDKAGKLLRPGVPVHLKDIHLEKGMHCVDCHFSQDSHGTGKLYGEPRAAIEIGCIDCHGSIEKRADPKGKTSGFAGGNKLSIYKVWVKGKSKKQPFLEEVKGQIIQHSAIDPEKSWEVVQTLDTITPGNSHYNEKSHLAKTVLKDGTTWGSVPKGENSTQLAHNDKNMTCYACHSSWMTSCFGCHLPMVANQKRNMLHNEGKPETRNWTQYNFQVLRDDIFMLGIDGTATGNRIAPVRSSSAVIVDSQNANRQQIYSQQQTVSAEGYSGQAFNTHVPHTVRGKGETKQCTDCHISKNNDNNAIMSQLLLQGTNFVNFFGKYVYVANGNRGFSAVSVTEREEPQAVIGSSLHKLAYPDKYQKHKANRDILKESYSHHGEVLNLQMRGEYLYAAEGEEGLHVYDIANVDNKDFSERITTAPVSPLGQKFYVKTKYATAVASPSTLAVDPTREHLSVNEEQPISPVYGYLYISDREEGLVIVGAATLLDGDPTNNFLKRALTFNPNGILNGAKNITIAGNYAYILCDRGLVIVNISNPLQPTIAAEVSGFDKPKAIAIQFRYGFITDASGLKVVDITVPEKAHLISGAQLNIPDAHGIYVARTYAYVAAKNQGLVIVDIENPEQPRIDQIFNAGGVLNDTNDVKVGMTNASLFAYVADGKNGLRVLQLTSPEDTPGYLGFSPCPNPQLIATFPVKGEALAVSKGLDRDRAVDESGNQVAVFGRRGARPFNLREMQRLYLHNGQIYKVTNEPPTPPINSSYKKEQETSKISKNLLGFMVIILPLILLRRYRR